MLNAKVSSEQFRTLFPVFETHTWLATPGHAPGATPVVEALKTFVQNWASGSCNWRAWEQNAESTRSTFGSIVGLEDASTISLQPSLGEAAAIVASSMRRRNRPAHIVVGQREFKSNLLPWCQLRECGARITMIPPEEGQAFTDAYLDALATGPTLLAVSDVQSLNGMRVRLPEIVHECRRRGTQLFLNLTQSAGVLRPAQGELEHVDYVAAHGYKWLLTPRGAAWFHIREDHIAAMSPLVASWKNVTDPYESYYGPGEITSSVARFDTSLAWPSWVGACSALELLSTIDPHIVEQHCLSLAAAARDALMDAGFRVVQPDMPSHIVAIHARNAEEVARELLSRGVVGTAREGYVRVGFHFFNKTDDVSHLVHALSESRCSLSPV